MLYFAYGSNLDPVQMLERCPDSRRYGTARLEHYRIHFDGSSSNWNGGAAANITPAYEHEVWGVLYELSGEDLARLDQFEHMPVSYQRFVVRALRPNGVACEAVAYLRLPQGQGVPAPAYVLTILAGATAHGLPPAYIRRLWTKAAQSRVV
jgi:gamma-glutamylcyclotransferase (GGCT)/AIG2-like uncharacterized protein YtfP